MSNFQPLKQKVKYSQGLTLIEVIVAVSLSVLLLGALYAVYITSYKSYKRNVIKAEINQNARIALERITRDLRQAERIVTALPPDKSDPLNPPSSSIKFQDGHITDQVQYIEYSLTNNELRRKVLHYYFSSDPETWVAWDAQDQYGSAPTESVDENAIKADKISQIQFYGNKVITIELVATNDDQNQYFKTETLGRNIQ